jgi:ABC-type antimicrobial peptide transport system ATPase subunit
MNQRLLSIFLEPINNLYQFFLMRAVPDSQERPPIVSNLPALATHISDTNQILTTNPIDSRRCKRSLSAKQRCNKKSTVRHRHNRYNCEIIRPVNINIVGYTLYISVKTKDHQIYYEQLLPTDVFL